MRSLTPLVHRQIRKRPGQISVFFLMSILAAVLLNLGVLMLSSYLPNIDRAAEEWNSPDAVVYLPAGSTADQFADRMARDSRITNYELAEAQAGIATLRYDDAELTVFAALLSQDQPELGRFTLVESTTDRVNDPVWVPAVLGVAGGYQLGDPITLTTSSGESTFHIQGFLEDTYGGITGSQALVFRVPDLAAIKAPGFSPVLQFQFNGTSLEDALDAKNEAIAHVKLATGEPLNPLWDGSLDAMRLASGVTSNVLAVLLVAFAGLIAIVMAVVMRFVLRNAVATDVEPIGALRAGGFTTAQIMISFLLLFAGIAMVGVIVGVGISYLLLPLVQQALRAQSGLSWDPEFSLSAFFVTFAVTLGIVVLAAWFAVYRIRRLSTVSALRGGHTTHSFTRSPLPLATSKGPLSTVLGLKSALQQVQQSVVLAGTVAVVAGAGVFAVGLTSTLMGDQTRIIHMLVGEVEDIAISVEPNEDVERLRQEIAKLPGVEAAGYSTVQTANIGGEFIVLQVADNMADWRYNPVYEGRLPRHSNEIVLGPGAARKLSLGIGDTFVADLGAGQVDYLVTGLATGARGGGQFLVMTGAAFQELDPTFTQQTIAVYTDGDVEALVAHIETLVGDRATVTNSAKAVQSEISSYLDLIPAISGTILFLTGGVVILVVSLVVSTMLVQSRRSLGIKKAMGYTHRELSAQTRWTYVPPVAIGALAGAFLSALTLGPLLRLLLGGVGVMKVDVLLIPWQFAAVPVAIVTLALLVTWLVSRKIRSVSAYRLVAE